MMRTRTRSAGLAVGLAALLVLAGCTSSAEQEPTPQVSDDQQAESPEPDASEIDRSARISVAAPAAVTQWDVARNVGGPEVAVLKLVYEGLTDVDEGMQPVPALATEWTTEDSGLTFDFTLRDDVVFTDGTPFDAEVAKENMDRMLTLEGSTLAAGLANVDSVEVVDDHVLRIVQKSPDVSLPAVLADRYGMMMSPKSWESDEIAVPVGSGRFVWVAEQQKVSLTLDRNEDYRDVDSVHLAGVDIQVMEDPLARMNAIKTGAVAMALVGADQIQEAESLPGVSLYRQKLNQRIITINPELEPALADPRVRLALNLAIDREGIVQGVLFGEGEAAYQPLPSGLYGYTEGLTGTYDPEQARELLEEAGYGDGLKFHFVSQPVLQKEAEVLQANWAEIGVEIDLELLPGPGAGMALWYEKTAAIGMLPFLGRMDPGITYTNLFGEGQVINASNLTTPEFSALLEEQASTVDPAQRAELFAEMSELLLAEPLGTWPIAYAYQGVAYSDDLVGVGEHALGFPVLNGVGKKG